MYSTERNPMWVEVGSRLRFLRERNNMSLQDVVNVLHGEISKSLVGMWETGERQVKIEMLCQLADFYNTTTDYILGRNDCRTVDATLESAVRYTETSETLIENIRAASSLPGITYFENSHFFEVCEKISNVMDNLDSLKDAIRFAEETAEQITYETEPDMISDRLSDALEGLDRGIKLSKLSIYEVNEINSEIVNDMFDSRALMKRAADLYRVLSDEYEASYTEYL